ncbi:MAG: dephospho-CoA kinase [Clostridia bacterium]
MVIGITGSSGAGKTTVCEILKQKYNFKVIAADDIAKNLSKKGTQYTKDIINEFGINVLLKNGEIDRKKIANIIYNDETKRKKLNNCTFKYIVKEIKEQIESQNGYNIALDAPLLFEADLNQICNKTVAVINENIDEQIERIIKRDIISKEEAIARIKSQQTNEFYIKNCDYKIINNNDVNSQIENMLKEIKIIY